MDQTEFLDKLPQSEKSLEIDLVNKKLLTIEQLEYALISKSLSGTTLVDVLLKEGLVSGEDLYKAVANHYNVEYVDLKKFPSSVDVLKKTDFFDYIKHNFIPWKKVGDIIFVAITYLSDDLFLYLKNKYPFGFRIIYTSPDYITLMIQRHFSELNLSMVKNELKAVEQIYSSEKLLSVTQKIKLCLVTIIFIILCVYFPKFMLLWALLMANVIFLSNLLLKIFLFSNGNITPKSEYKNMYNDQDLPIYTILLPLYKESSSLYNLMEAMKRLNYPKSKLDIIFVLEEFDRETISSLRKQKYSGFFRVICVPKSYPKTKPKACSYALKFAKGEYITIFDAEDRPEPDQLLKAINCFSKSDEKVACLQAKLFCINYKESLLSFLFSLEYLIWFGWLLKGLQNLNMPIPLGGTSNHFKTDILRLAGGWDPYNVTEDADLGYRLAKHGYKTKILDSVTWEEAPIELSIWLRQRSRWIKGHIQTYIVHLRNSFKFVENYGIRGLIGFHGFLILPILTYFLQVLILTQIFFSGFDSLNPFLKWLSITNVFLWIIFSISTSVFVAIKNKYSDVNCFLFLACPFYCFLHLISAIMAVYDIIFRTHYWAKTPHNLDKRLKIG